MFRRLFVTLAIATLPATAAAQNGPGDVRDEILMQFNNSARKTVALAEAMPAELYSWSPGEGIMSVGRVYAHIARYNFMYPDQSLGVAAPSDLNLRTMEDLTDKDAIVRVLRRSVEHARSVMENMSEHDIMSGTRLYGRNISQWAVLVQLVAHMNEHVGQSVAYARVNGVVPPWSR